MLQREDVRAMLRKMMAPGIIASQAQILYIVFSFLFFYPLMFPPPHFQTATFGLPETGRRKGRTIAKGPC